MKTLNFLILSVLTSVLVSCEKPASIESGDSGSGFSLFPVEPTKSPYPIKRVIRDNQGRPLDGTIMAKTADQLYVTRGYDGMNFKIAIDTLEESDRKFAEDLPEKVPPGDFQLGPSPALEVVPPYVATRRESIKRLTEENARLQEEAESTTNSMLRSSRLSQIKRNDEEILRLGDAIKAYQIQNP